MVLDACPFKVAARLATYSEPFRQWNEKVLAFDPGLIRAARLAEPPQKSCNKTQKSSDDIRNGPGNRREKIIAVCCLLFSSHFQIEVEACHPIKMDAALGTSLDAQESRLCVRGHPLLERFVQDTQSFVYCFNCSRHLTAGTNYHGRLFPSTLVLSFTIGHIRRM
jgi:hypothetical protein